MHRELKADSEVTLCVEEFWIVRIAELSGASSFVAREFSLRSAEILQWKPSVDRRRGDFPEWDGLSSTVGDDFLNGKKREKLRISTEKTTTTAAE